jgi:hypothetical protein
MPYLSGERKNDCEFFRVKDANLKKSLIKLTHCRPDANSFTFWRSVSDNNFWGLTMKSVTWPPYGQQGTPVDNWKLTLFNNKVKLTFNY